MHGDATFSSKWMCAVRRLLIAAVLVAVVAALAACSGDPEGTGRADATGGQGAGADILLSFGNDAALDTWQWPADANNTFVDLQSGTDAADGQAIADAQGTDPDASADSTDGAGQQSCEFPFAAAAGQAGAPCNIGPDCQSGFCVDSADGKVCTVACDTCCPKGYGCRLVELGADSAYLCVPQWTALCRPCALDAECAGLTAGSLCVSAGDAGRYCGAPCTDSAQCPTGYACQPSEGSNSSAAQCTRVDGVCGCSALAIAQGATTACSVSNAAGSCTGARSCTPAGLSPCSAATPTPEACNNADDNCNGLTDEGCDDDADGYCDVGLVVTGLPTVCPAGPGDCNDAEASVNPAATDICGNGVDDDCSGATDDVGVQAWFPDADQDGAGDAAGQTDSCQPPVGYVANALDCDDSNAQVSPTATEVCNQLDDDCNDIVDDEGAKGCSPYFADQDKDGFGGLVPPAVCLCGPSVTHPTAQSGDCNDEVASIAPDASETCNQQDDNCNGATDESGGPVRYLDADADGWGTADQSTTACQAAGYVAQPGDCNDATAAINPAAAEVCDGVDQDCNAQTDDVTCDDGEACTTDSCAGALGCQFQPKGPETSCDDGNPCTQDDACSAGACAGVGLSCNDGNVCTTDSCDGNNGCTNTPNASACNDDNACTTADACAAGACSGKPVGCEDNNPCTLDSCASQSGCTHVAVLGPCTDADPCTTAEACAGGQCGGQPLVCQDNNPCTQDSCLAGVGCSHAPVSGAACTDGNACTAADTCSGGLCLGAAVSCNDANPCTDDACTPAFGCSHTPNTAPCDDGNACTAGDACSNGTCAANAVDCTDANPCTTNGCNPATGCTVAFGSGACDDGKPCTTSDVCSGGVCAGTAKVCTDGNPCTTDSCNQTTGNCTFTNNTLSCNDGQACTNNDKCSSGNCVGTALVCNDGLSCTADSCSNGNCVYASTCASGFTCDAASNACKANVVGCTLPSGACTDGSQSGKGCFYARTISRKTAAATTTITADTCLFSDTNNFSIDGCAVDGGYDRGYRLFVRKGESLAVELTSNGSCSSASPRLFVYRPPTGCGAPAFDSCTASTLVSSCGATKYNTTATEDAWYVLVADGDSFNEGTKYKLKVTLSNCAVAGCECP